MKPRTIGFVDYQLDNYHANVFLKLLREDLGSRGWEVAMCRAMRAQEGRQWASEKKIHYAEDPRELCDCDGIMILAPSNPEVHLDLARQVFPLGRPTYVDKTFATDHKTARQIFALADRHRVPIFTTSALRCAASLQKLVADLGKDKIRHVRAWGGGRSFGEYVIHPLEMVDSTMGSQVRHVMRLTDDANHHQVHIRFAGGRTGSVFVHTKGACAFQAVLTTDERTAYVNTSPDPIFRDLAGMVLDFFESGQPPVDRRETLAIFRVLDAASNKKAKGNFVKV